MKGRLYPLLLVLVSLLAILFAPMMLRPGSSQSRAVRTQSVEIVDASGAVRITLDAYGGKPSVWLYDGNRQRRLGLTISAHDLPEVALHDGQGRSRMVLRVGAERAAEVSMTDALGRPRIGIWVDYRDDPAVWMYDELRRARIGMKVSKGIPRLWLFEPKTGRVVFTAP